MVHPAPTVANAKTAGDCVFTTSADRQYLIQAVGIGSERRDFTTDTGEIQTKPIDRLDSAIAAGGDEVRTDVENLQSVAFAARDTGQILNLRTFHCEIGRPCWRLSACQSVWAKKKAGSRILVGD